MMTELFSSTGLSFVCGCGLANYNIEDWLCHFKSRGWKRGLVLLLTTKIVAGRSLA